MTTNHMQSLYSHYNREIYQSTYFWFKKNVFQSCETCLTWGTASLTSWFSLTACFICSSCLFKCNIFKNLRNLYGLNSESLSTQSHLSASVWKQKKTGRFVVSLRALLKKIWRKTLLNEMYLGIQQLWYYFPTIQSHKKWLAVIASIDLFPQVRISFRASIFSWQAARD